MGMTLLLLYCMCCCCIVILVGIYAYKIVCLFVASLRFQIVYLAVASGQVGLESEWKSIMYVHMYVHIVRKYVYVQHICA